MQRRLFLSTLTAAPAFLRAQPSRAQVLIDPSRSIATINRNIFGSFLEHLGRAIYEGIYDPGNPLSDGEGFRKDVAGEIKQMNVPIVRYPGGNFVSGYHWMDGVGPKSERPTVLERAWNSVETNQFGTNEFMAWCKMVGTEPLLGLNFGTASAEDAANYVEYCNAAPGTKYSNLRRQHGYAEPYQVKHWCLGNEMDGPWQIGHMDAVSFGRKTNDAARQMRYVDKDLTLIACGSSNNSMPQYAEWDRLVLEECYPLVDGISLHRYFGNHYDNGTKPDPRRYLAENLTFEAQIDGIIATADYVGAKLKTRKKLFLSFDEWNVWYRQRGGDGQRVKAPHLLEEIYNLEDALLVGGLINSLIRRSERVKVACLAQLVNVIAPIMTNEKGLYRQTIYYPYAWALAHAKGKALDLRVESASYDTPLYPRETEHVPYVDVAATLDGNRLTLLLLNRDLDASREVEISLHEMPNAKVLESLTLTGKDLKAANTFASPNLVVPQKLDAPVVGSGRLTVSLPAQSYSMVRVTLG